MSNIDDPMLFCLLFDRSMSNIYSSVSFHMPCMTNPNTWWSSSALVVDCCLLASNVIISNCEFVCSLLTWERVARLCQNFQRRDVFRHKKFGEGVACKKTESWNFLFVAAPVGCTSDRTGYWAHTAIGKPVGTDAGSEAGAWVMLVSTGWHAYAYVVRSADGARHPIPNSGYDKRGGLGRARGRYGASIRRPT